MSTLASEPLTSTDFYYYSPTTVQAKEPDVTGLLRSAFLDRDTRIMSRDLPRTSSSVRSMLELPVV